MAAGLEPDRSPAVRAEPRAGARRAHLAPQLHRDLRRAAPHDPVQGEVRGPGVGRASVSSTTRCSWRPTSSSTTPTEVPVGDDQRQHVELTRDIAIRFNHTFGDVFVVPKATFPPVGARIMDLQQPTKKMSKSDDSPQGTILVLEEDSEGDREEDQVRGHRLRTRRSATTASRSPASRTSSRSTARSPARRSPTVEKEFAGQQYGSFKTHGRRRRRRVSPAGTGALRGARRRSRRGRPPARARCRSGRGEGRAGAGPGHESRRTPAAPRILSG